MLVWCRVTFQRTCPIQLLFLLHVRPTGNMWAEIKMLAFWNPIGCTCFHQNNILYVCDFVWGSLITLYVLLFLHILQCRYVNVAFLLVRQSQCSCITHITKVNKHWKCFEKQYLQCKMFKEVLHSKIIQRKKRKIASKIIDSREGSYTYLCYIFILRMCMLCNLTATY